MATVSSLDLEVRLQIAGQKYSEILSKYVDSLRYGKKSFKSFENKLQLLGIYIELLQDFVVDECGYDNTNNCMTEEDAQLVADKISKLTGYCFQNLGYRYSGDRAQSGISKMQIGCNFVVS